MFSTLIPDLEGILSEDSLYAEVGSPPQDPFSDGYFPRERLNDIRERHIEGLAATIEQVLNDREPDDVAHLSEVRPFEIKKDFSVRGLAGCALPEDVIRYIFRAAFVPAPVGGVPSTAPTVALAYDGDLDRLAGRTLPGGAPYYRIRLSGGDVEVLPNVDGAVVLYLVTKTKALEGVLPTLLADLNSAILKDAKAAVREATGVKFVVKAQAKEEAA